MNRNRQRGGFVGETVSYYTETCSAYNPNGQFLLAVGTVESMSDVVVKGFTRRRARGEVFFNPMIRVATTISSGGGFAENRSTTLQCSPAKNLRHKWVGNWIANFVPSSVVSGLIVPSQNYALSDARVASLQTEVSTALLSQRGRSDSNLFETLAEADQVLGLLENPLARYRRFLNGFGQKAQAAKAAGRLASGASSLYLQYRYGVKPILSDIQAVLQGLKKTTSKHRKTTRVALKDVSVTSTNLSYPSHVTYGVNLRVDDELTLRAMALDEVELSLWENVGFTPKGLITLPWELITLSFVADWFANIGDFIGAYAPSPGWTLLGSCLVTDRKTTSTWTSLGSTSTTSYSVVSSATGSLKREDRTKTRAFVQQPGLVIKSDFKFDKATRVLDALALSVIETRRLASFINRG